jgi:AraC family transcriptional regulator
MRFDSSDLHITQKDGGLPALTAADAVPGESGISVLGLRFEHGVHFKAVPRQHLVWLPAVRVHMTCRRADRVILEKAVPAGSMAICPAGLASSGDAEEGARRSSTANRLKV